jgi:hypothetical protein
MPSLSYGTPSTTLSYKECEDIQRPVVSAILPKMGIVHNAARTVVFGSAKYYGLGLDHLETVQNFSRLQYLIGHIRRKSITSKLIHHELDYTQLEICCSTQVLGRDYKRYRHTILCPNWITVIWESLLEARPLYPSIRNGLPTEKDLATYIHVWNTAIYPISTYASFTFGYSSFLTSLTSDMTGSNNGKSTENVAINNIALGTGQCNKYHPVWCGTNGNLRYQASSPTSKHYRHLWMPGSMLRYTMSPNGGWMFGNGASIDKPMGNGHSTHITHVAVYASQWHPCQSHTWDNVHTESKSHREPDILK